MVSFLHYLKEVGVLRLCAATIACVSVATFFRPGEAAAEEVGDCEVAGCGYCKILKPRPGETCAEACSSAGGRFLKDDCKCCYCARKIEWSKAKVEI